MSSEWIVTTIDPEEGVAESREKLRGDTIEEIAQDLRVLLPASDWQGTYIYDEDTVWGECFEVALVVASRAEPLSPVFKPSQKFRAISIAQGLGGMQIGEVVEILDVDPAFYVLVQHHVSRQGLTIGQDWSATIGLESRPVTGAGMYFSMDYHRDKETLWFRRHRV